MKIDKYIQSVLEKFYLLTNIPVQSYSYDKKIIASIGLNSHDMKVFKVENFLAEIDFDEININKTISFKNNIHFTIISICPKDKHSGVFIMGPYTSTQNANYSYKPLFLRDYMITNLRMIWRDYTNNKESSSKKPYSFHVKKALDYIESNYKDDLKLDDVSNYLNINKSYFCSILKKETGTTFTQHLNQIRIEKSKFLLINKDYSMLDIALSVGFNNQNYYNIIFKKLTQITPLEYRNRNVS